MPEQHFVDSEHSLANQIHCVLASCPGRWGKRVCFEMDNGQVLLKGIVRSYYHKQLIQESLRSVPGVERIQNEIQVIY